MTKEKDQLSVKRFSSRKEKVNVVNIYFRGKRCRRKRSSADEKRVK